MRTLATLFLICAVPCFAAEPRVVPLGEIVTNTGQRGMVPIRSLLRALPDARRQFESTRLSSREAPSYATQVLLVKGDDFWTASQACWLGGDGSIRGDELLARNTTSDQHWLAAYLGGGSSTPTLVVESLTVSEREVVFAYRKLPPGEQTCDIVTKWYWAPLGQLPVGLYQVKLFDLDKQRPTLVRYVEVLDPPKRLPKKQPQIRVDERK